MPDMTLSKTASDQKKSNDAYFNSLWSDDMYMKQIEQYKNESWYDRLLENPWLASKQNRFETDPITGMFNFQGAAAKYYGDMRTNAEDWLAKRVAEMKEQEYNSAPEQAARLRAAGQNPDLNGGVTAGEAAQNDTATAPAQLQNGTSETGLAIAQAGMNFIGNILSFGKEIQGLNLGSLQKVSSELGLASGARDLALNAISSIMPSHPGKDTIDGVISLMPRIFSGYSKKTRKLLESYLGRYSGDNLGVEALVSELRRKMVLNNRTSAEIMSSPYYSSDLNEWISNIGDKLSKYIAQFNEYQARVSANKAAVEDVYWNQENNQNFLGNTMAAEQNAAYQSAQASSAYHEWKKNADKTWNELEKSVKGDGKHWYNTIGVIMLYFLRSQIEGATLGFSRGSSQHLDNSGNIQNLSSSSFHF